MGPLLTLVVTGCASSSPPIDSHREKTSSSPSSTPVSAGPVARAIAPAAGACKSAPFVDTRGRPPDSEAMTATKPGRDVPFQGASCRGDRDVWRDAKDRIRVCTLRDSANVAGFALAGDNYTLFHDNGVPYQTTLAKGVPISTPSGRAVDCTAGFAVITRDRQLEGCVLARGARFGDFAARGGSDVSFHPDGSLAAAVLDLPVTVLGVSLPPGTRARFYPSGRVSEIQLDNPVEIAGYVVQSTVSLYESGGLASFTLAESHRVATLALEAFAQVWLYEDGRPWHVELVSARGFMVHGEPWTDTRKVTFDCSGQVTGDETSHYQSAARPPKFR